jgi:hydroxymethylpyrimidine/phosphomethylpyrimidine kinase
MRRPLVLVIGGLDPSGAGLQADIETCFALGCHALPVATGLTIQNTRGLARVIPASGADLLGQLEHLLADVGPVAACKIGMLPSADAALAIGKIVSNLPASAAVILDPVMTASAGGTLMLPSLQDCLPQELLARTTLIKPNLHEARRLTGAETAEEAGMRLCGEAPLPPYALVTGGDAPEKGQVRHLLYRRGRRCAEFSSPHINGLFHGTGCTLSSAIAAGCARGIPLESAVGMALEYTWGSVRHAFPIGGAQAIPDRRWFWQGEYP